MSDIDPPRPPSAFRPDDAAAEARARRLSELGRPRGALWLGALMAVGYGVANYLLGLMAVGSVREGALGAYLGAAQHLVLFGVQVAHALHLRRKGLTRTSTGLALMALALFLPFSMCWMMLIDYAR